MANDDDRSHLQEEDEATKKLEVSTAIEKILNSLRNVQWSLEETSQLLRLVEEHQEDWLTIHERLRKKGFCLNLETEEIIMYFLSLPQRGLTCLVEEYSDEEFIEHNMPSFSLDRGHIQSKLQDCLSFTRTASQE